MQQLPYVVVTNPHIKDVYNMYYDAFETFRKCREIKTLEENDELCKMISQNLKGHLTVIPKLAMGMLECGGIMNPNTLEKFMNTILRSVGSQQADVEMTNIETFSNKKRSGYHVGSLQNSTSRLPIHSTPPTSLQALSSPKAISLVRFSSNV